MLLNFILIPGAIALMLGTAYFIYSLSLEKAFKKISNKHNLTLTALPQQGIFLKKVKLDGSIKNMAFTINCAFKYKKYDPANQANNVNDSLLDFYLDASAMFPSPLDLSFKISSKQKSFPVGALMETKAANIGMLDFNKNNLVTGPDSRELYALLNTDTEFQQMINSLSSTSALFTITEDNISCEFKKSITKFEAQIDLFITICGKIHNYLQEMPPFVDKFLELQGDSPSQEISQNAFIALKSLYSEDKKVQNRFKDLLSSQDPWLSLESAHAIGGDIFIKHITEAFDSENPGRINHALLLAEKRASTIFVPYLKEIYNRLDEQEDIDTTALVTAFGACGDLNTVELLNNLRPNSLNRVLHKSLDRAIAAIQSRHGGTKGMISLIETADSEGKLSIEE